MLVVGSRVAAVAEPRCAFVGAAISIVGMIIGCDWGLCVVFLQFRKVERFLRVVLHQCIRPRDYHIVLNLSSSSLIVFVIILLLSRRTELNILHLFFKIKEFLLQLIYLILTASSHTAFGFFFQLFFRRGKPSIIFLTLIVKMKPRSGFFVLLQTILESQWWKWLLMSLLVFSLFWGI